MDEEKKRRIEEAVANWDKNWENWDPDEDPDVPILCHLERAIRPITDEERDIVKKRLASKTKSRE